ncbi:MAG: helix-turn-helix domain-containing protein [Caldibacillus sp.]
MGNLIRGWKKDEFNAPSLIWCVDIDTKCKITYLYIVYRLENGDDCPSHSQIARACSFSKRTAEKATKMLHEYGLIRKIHRKKPGTNENDSNRYIVYHPLQVKGLPWIKDPEGSEINSPPVANNVRQGSEINSPPVANDVRQGSEIDSHLSLSVGSSVCSSDDVTQIRAYWKKAFNEEPSEFEIEEILSYKLPIDKVKEIIRKVRLYIDIRTSPFAVVIRAIAAASQGEEWQWNENHSKPNKAKRWEKRKDNKSDNLPKVLQKQDEEYGYEEVPSEKQEKFYRELRSEKQKKSSPEKIENRLKKLRIQLREEQGRAIPNYSIISSLEREIEELERELERLSEKTGA